MLQACTVDKDLIWAKDARETDGPFRCPRCSLALSLKKGCTKAAHFAHVIAGGCQAGQEESRQFQHVKTEMMMELQTYPHIVDIQCSSYWHKQTQPDVYGVHLVSQKQDFWTSTRLGIEIVMSPHVSLPLLEQRMECYQDQNIFVACILAWKQNLVDGATIHPTVLESYLHMLYYGVVLYWHNRNVQPVTYRSLTTEGLLYPRVSTRKDWIGAGMPRRAKEKLLQFHPPLKLRDLQKREGRAWQEGKWTLPARKLWTLPAM